MTTKPLHATICLPDGQTSTIIGDNLAELAGKLHEQDSGYRRATVYDDHGFIRGYIYGNGEWTHK